MLGLRASSVFLTPQSPPALGIHRHTPTATRDATASELGPDHRTWVDRTLELPRQCPNSLKGTQV